ncbi:MAG: carbohydrate ABC transporter permease [Candidatus Bipolaricaulota bacterium]|nr:carbohydrate ABC transporter permease [Candidatus Bipolaricaulota bacterium]MDW8152487.1 carbohydrate ABC transporter permease [Candidatus Bipolaricaulota bacterium]
MQRRSSGYWVRRAIWLLFVYGLLLFTVLLTALPFFWMVTTSLKERAAVHRIPPQWIPNPALWQNYVEAWNSAPFGRYFFNSFFIALTTTVGDVVTSIPAGYALAKMTFLGRGVILALLLGTLMIPGQMLLVPTFILVNRIGWYNTYQVLIIPWTAGVFGIFLLRQFFKTVPDELWDSARIDGCSRLRYMFQIAVPLIRPGIATVALLKFVASWNAFLWIIVMTDKVELRTVPVGLRFLQMEMGDYHHLLMAAATMAIVPILVLFFFAQKQFIQGIARTGLK